jgi:23S rRNA (guanosine2251-2'-O)-methyltransferase
MEFRQCENENCQLRFPAEAAEMVGPACPRCGGATTPIHSKLGTESIQRKESRAVNRKIVAILDNIRSAYNVGSIIRTADGAGLSHLYFCGITAPQDHPRIAKTALGSERVVDITHHPNGYLLTEKLKASGFYLIALERDLKAISVFDQDLALPDQPLALIIGNEISGIDPGILDLCQVIVDLPMIGIKQSLNVVVAFGIAVYHLRYRLSNS